MRKTEADVELVASGLMTVKQAALFLGLCPASIYNLIAQGSLVTAKIGRSRRIPRTALEVFASSCLQGGGAK